MYLNKDGEIIPKSKILAVNGKTVFNTGETDQN